MQAGSITDVNISFRESSYGRKLKNNMLRTTYGLRDEASSDTVSTEFNYLQPTVRRLEQRASIGTTSYHAGSINV